MAYLVDYCGESGKTFDIFGITVFIYKLGVSFHRFLFLRRLFINYL